MDGDDAEVGEGVEVLEGGLKKSEYWLVPRVRCMCSGVEFIAHLHLGDLVLPKPELLQSCQRLEVFDFLTKGNRQPRLHRVL